MKEELAKIIHEKVAQVKEQTYKEIEALKSENARLLEITHTAIAENTKLTEQLKNAVVLPCVDDIIICGLGTAIETKIYAALYKDKNGLRIAELRGEK